MREPLFWDETYAWRGHSREPTMAQVMRFWDQIDRTEELYEGHDMDRRFLLLPLKADQSTDLHPEILREWTRDGFETPPGWYHVSAYTDTDQILMMLRERINDKDETIRLCRGVYWHISPEYVGEVARQLREGERQAFSFNLSSNRYVPYPVAYTRITECSVDGAWLTGDPVFAPKDRKVSPETK
jgi:hypothetical protein